MVTKPLFSLIRESAYVTLPLKPRPLPTVALSRSLPLKATSSPLVLMRPTFCTRLMLLLAAASNLSCEYSASRVASVNSVKRSTLLPKSFSAVSSVVHDFSGLRFGSLTYCALTVAVAPYNSPTVGKRTARPVEALSVVSAVHCQDSAAFGDTALSLRAA